MPIGSGAVSITNDPRSMGVEFLPDPRAFFELTEKNEYQAISKSTPGSGKALREPIPQNGLVSKLRILFEGVITTTLGGGTVTTTSEWPYGFLDDCKVSANAQNDLVSVSGVDLHALRAIRHPGFVPNDGVDLSPAAAGAGNTIANGANTLVLSWEVPIAIDDTSLVGALFAQSPSMNLDLTLRQAVTTDLLVAAGGATIDSITGTWYVQPTSFDIPLGGGDRPELIIPDLTRLHGLNTHTVPYSNLGDVRVPLIKVGGQLDRLLVQVAKADPAGAVTAQFLGWTADLDEVTSIRLMYGGSQRPLDYNPAHFLAAQNLEDYSDELPYGFAAFDFLTQNAPRDVVIMPGVTNLEVVPTVGSGVVLAAGSRVRVLQETLFT